MIYTVWFKKIHKNTLYIYNFKQKNQTQTTSEVSSFIEQLKSFNIMQ